MQPDPLISIIIPSYNAAVYLPETLASIQEQTEVAKEVIIIDDGSTDNTGEIIRQNFADFCTYIYQENKGVSSARNLGLTYANGEFVIFFDADDKMSPGFLKQRLNALIKNVHCGYSCGKVETFPVNQPVTLGTFNNITEQMLIYDDRYNSCPSNYLIRMSILNEYNLQFNPKLMSTADRFFLIQMDKVSKGCLVEDAPLLYRVSPNSMSNSNKLSLFIDNELYYLELEAYNLIPTELRKQFRFNISYILGLGFMRHHQIRKACSYLSKAFYLQPGEFIRRRIQKLVNAKQS